MNLDDINRQFEEAAQEDRKQHFGGEVPRRSRQHRVNRALDEAAMEKRRPEPDWDDPGLQNLD